MTGFSAVIKVLLENRLVPTVIGLISGAIIYAFSSEDNWMLQKLGTLGYGLVWSGVAFLGITFIQYLVKQIKRMYDGYRAFIKDKRYDEEEHKKLIEQLWFFIDGLDQNYIEFLKEFLDNNNETIEKTGWDIPSFPVEYFNFRRIIIERHIEREGKVVYLYKMDEKIFSLLRESKEKYNKISHFE